MNRVHKSPRQWLGVQLTFQVELCDEEFRGWDMRVRERVCVCVGAQGYCPPPGTLTVRFPLKDSH